MSIVQRTKAVFKTHKEKKDADLIQICVEATMSVIDNEKMIPVPIPAVDSVNPPTKKAPPEYLTAVIREVPALRPTLLLPRFQDAEEPTTPSSAYTGCSLFVTNTSPVISSISTANTSLHSTCSSIGSCASPTLSPLTESSAFALRLDDFTQIRGLGAGGFGSVYLVKHGPSGLQVALKAVDKRTCEHKDVIAEQNALLNVATHGTRGVMEFLGSFHNRRHYFLVTSYYPGGDLKTEIRRWGRLPIKLVKFYAAELLLAIQSIHDRGYLHRDIKPDNILLTYDGHLVLSDFGLAATLVPAGETFEPGSDCKWFLQDLVGTLNYLAPEMWKGEPYSFSVDVWAYGIVVFEMLFGRTPWTGSMDDSLEVMDNHMKHETLDEWLGADCPDATTRLFLEGMLERDAFDRPTLGEASSHPFLRGISWSKLARGDLRVPDVGPPPKQDSNASKVFFGSFGGGGVYMADEDPLPKFNYISPALAVSDPLAVYPRKSSSSSCFVDVPLSDESPVCGRSTSRGSPIIATPGSGICSTTDNTRLNDDIRCSQLPNTRNGIEVAVEHKRLTLLARISKFVDKAFANLKKICTFFAVRC